MNDSKKPDTKFCLFHQKPECVCIEPITDKDKLKSRLEHIIRLNTQLLKCTANPIDRARQMEEIEKAQKRLV